MKNGLLDPAILSFVFTPLAAMVALLFFLAGKRLKGSRAQLPTTDAPGLLLATAVHGMPEERREWGAAMIGELSQIPDRASRWWFAIGGVRVALFPPRPSRLLSRALAGQSPVCGMLAVTLPPLGLPFIYFAAVIVEAIGGSPLTQSSSWTSPEAVIELVKILVMLTFSCLLAGVPLGLAGLLRRERLRWLSMLGMLFSPCIIVYFLVVMRFVAGGPNGD